MQTRSPYRWTISRMCLRTGWLLGLCLWILTAGSGQAQQRSADPYTASLDTVQHVLDQVKELRQAPLSTDYDSLQQAYQVAQAYREWAYTKPVYQWSLARVTRINNAEHRAEAELMSGVLNGALLQRHIRMGSGVMPLLDASITHLDSARVYYQMIEKFTVSNASERVRADARFARTLSDSLHHLRDRLLNANSYLVLKEYDAQRLFYDAFQPDPAEEAPNVPSSSVSFWAIHPNHHRDYLQR
jgi:hypothetical protein